MQKTLTTNESYKDDNILKIEIIGFSKENFLIEEAKIYNFDCNNKDDFIYFITGLYRRCNKKQDILLSDISIKKNKNIAKYLKQNLLVLTHNTYLPQELSVKQYIKLMSLMYCNFDLSDATINSFFMKKIENIKIQHLSIEKKQLVILSLVVCCPNIIWIIDNELIKNLSTDSKSIFDNAVKIRLKQGGAVIFI